jgi:hypothetical protein
MPPSIDTPKHPPSPAKCTGGGLRRLRPSRRRGEPQKGERQEGIGPSGFRSAGARILLETKALKPRAFASVQRLRRVTPTAREQRPREGYGPRRGARP